MLEKHGVVETERFIVVINKEKIDYLKWQRERFDNMSPEEFISAMSSRLPWFDVYFFDKVCYDS